MAETGAVLADKLLPALPLRRWIISFLFAFRCLCASSSMALNLCGGYRQRHWRVVLDVPNLLDGDDHDIDCFYDSRLDGEAQPVADLHYYVMELRAARIPGSYLH